MLQTDDGLVLQAFRPQDVIGRWIVAECGEKHLVEQISYSHRYADMMLLNEHDEDQVEKVSPLWVAGGKRDYKTSPNRHWWVHLLSLSCQMHGLPLPTVEQKAACSRAFSCLRWEPTDGPEKGGSGLVLPGGLTLVKK